MDEKTHPWTQMLDMIEEIRLVVQRRPASITSAQVLAVLASVMADHTDAAFTALSRRSDPIPTFADYNAAMGWQEITAAHRTGQRMLVAWCIGDFRPHWSPTGAFWTGATPDDLRGVWALDSGTLIKAPYMPTHCMPMPNNPESKPT